MPRISRTQDLKSPGFAGRAGEVPIGGIIDWYKNTIGTGSVLPDGWVECNGQVLSDGESSLNGNTIPDINGSISGQQNFRRNGTSASSARTGNLDGTTSVPAASLSLGSISITPSGSGTSIVTSVAFTNTGAASQSQILPSYFVVVAIMRVK